MSKDLTPLSCPLRGHGGQKWHAYFKRNDKVLFRNLRLSYLPKAARQVYNHINYRWAFHVVMG